jgi:hypothetical protein
MIAVNDTSDITQLKQGGVDPGSFAFLDGSMKTFDRMAGNLETLAGYASHEKTATQAGMVHQAAASKPDKMSKRVISRTTRLLKALGLMLWDDAFTEMVIQIPISGTPYVVTDVWEPGDREGNFLDYNFEIDVYSMQYQSPASKLAALDQYVQGVIMPMAPFLQMMGGYVDMMELNDEYATLLNYPNLRNIVKFGGITLEGSASPVTDIPRKPPTSTRNYVRHNVSSGNQGTLGDSASMMTAAASGPQTAGGMT